MVNKLFSLFKGKKTYIAAAISIVWAAYGYQNGLIPTDSATQIVLEALMVFGLRSAMK